MGEIVRRDDPEGMQRLRAELVTEGHQAINGIHIQQHRFFAQAVEDIVAETRLVPDPYARDIVATHADATMEQLHLMALAIAADESNHIRNFIDSL